MPPYCRCAAICAKVRGHFGTGPIVGARFCNDGRAVLERRTCGQSHSAGHGSCAQSTRGAASNHLYPRDVLWVQWQIQQVMVRVRCAPTDAVNPQGRLIERSPSNAEVRLDAKGSSGTNVHPRDGLQHVCDGRGRGLSHFLLANDHKGARRFLGQRFRQTPRHGSRLNGCGVDRHGRLGSSNKATAQAINSAVVIRIGWVFMNFSSFSRLSSLRFGTNLRTLFVLSQWLWPYI